MKKLTLLFLGLILISCGKGDDSSSLEEIQNGEFVNSNPGIWLLDYTEADDNYSSSIYGTLTIESQSLSWDIFETYQDGYTDDTNKYYFEFKIQVDEITKDVSLIITDFEVEDEIEESKMLWNNLVSDLKQVLGAS